MNSYRNTQEIEDLSNTKKRFHNRDIFSTKHLILYSDALTTSEHYRAACDA